MVNIEETEGRMKNEKWGFSTPARAKRARRGEEKSYGCGGLGKLGVREETGSKGEWNIFSSFGNVQSDAKDRNRRKEDTGD